MLGSRRKVALTRRLLESRGVSPAQLERLHAPVGLPIGADTPEEIAISVVAEMIAERRRDAARRGGATDAMQPGREGASEAVLAERNDADR
jgi:xanthine dehydrogenase accessory factor